MFFQIYVIIVVGALYVISARPLHGRNGAWYVKHHPLAAIKEGSSIDIVARSFELSHPIKERTENKIGNVVRKLGPDAISTKVVLQVLKSATGSVPPNKQCLFIK